MALADIILPNGKVILIQSTSTAGVVPKGGSAVNFGTIQAVSQLTDKTSVGDSVWFDITKAVPFTIVSGQQYFLVDEADLTSYETAI